MDDGVGAGSRSEESLSRGSSGLGNFERFLTAWVTLAILAGIGLGLVMPGVFERVADIEVAQVNLVVAALIWLMIYPMMLKVEPDCLSDVRHRPKGLILTLTINWLVKPFTMAGLAYLFFRYVYADFVTAGEADEYIAGMILLGVAPCTAMVFVWSQLTNGNPNYTLAQVSINDLILVFAFAPIAGLLLGVTDLIVPWATLIASVAIFVVVPLAAGLATRSSLIRRDGPEAVEAFAGRLKATSIIGLLLARSYDVGSDCWGYPQRIGYYGENHRARIKDPHAKLERFPSFLGSRRERHLGLSFNRGRNGVTEPR